MSPLHELLYQSQALFWWVFPISAGIAAAVFGSVMLSVFRQKPPPLEPRHEHQRPRS